MRYGVPQPPSPAHASTKSAQRVARSVSVNMRIMRVYLVGGAVRDRLLGLPVHERDWVVVGARPEELERAGD